jgi:hypothetical protein
LLEGSYPKIGWETTITVTPIGCWWLLTFVQTIIDMHFESVGTNGGRNAGKMRAYNPAGYYEPGLKAMTAQPLDAEFTVICPQRNYCKLVVVSSSL